MLLEKGGTPNRKIIGYETLACHPITTRRCQLSPEELAKAGVTEGLVRLSIGIEHIDDLMEDIDQALNAAK